MNLPMFLILLPVGLLIFGLGVYAWFRKKPMWFYSGTTVRESEITDVKAYNHANGVMWAVFSLPFIASAFLGLFGIKAAVYVEIGGIAAGIPFLLVTYHLIYRKYHRKETPETPHEDTF